MGIQSIFPVIKFSQPRSWLSHAAAGQVRPARGSERQVFHLKLVIHLRKPSINYMSCPRLLPRWLRQGCQSSCQSFSQPPPPAQAPLPAAGIAHRHPPGNSPTLAVTSPPRLWCTAKRTANATDLAGLNKQVLMVRLVQK